MTEDDKARITRHFHEMSRRHYEAEPHRTDGFDTQGLPIALNARIAFSLGITPEALVPIMVRLRDAGLVIERRETRMVPMVDAGT